MKVDLVVIQFNQKKTNYIIKGKLCAQSRMRRRDGVKIIPKQLELTPKISAKLPAKGKPVIPKLNVEKITYGNQYFIN